MGTKQKWGRTVPIRPQQVQTEEKHRALHDIHNGVDAWDQLGSIRRTSMPILEDICARMEVSLGLPSEIGNKSDLAAAAKCARPSTSARYPWFAPRHLRDFLRFRTRLFELADFDRVFDFFAAEARRGNVGLVKVDGGKLARPGVFGWRMVAIDIRLLSTGMLVEHYMTFADLIDANQEWLHPVYERWRGRDPDSMTLREFAAMDRDQRLSTHAYRELMTDLLADGPAADPLVRTYRGLTETQLTAIIDDRIVTP